jgi:hypothetical protein
LVFEVADHLDGTTVRCTKCQRPIKVCLGAEMPRSVAAGLANAESIAMGPPPVPAPTQPRRAPRERTRSGGKGVLIAGAVALLLLGFCLVGAIGIFGVGTVLFWRSAPRRDIAAAPLAPEPPIELPPFNPIKVVPPILDPPPVILPPILKEPAKVVVIQAALGADGQYSTNNELTAVDACDTAHPTNPHKRYEVQLEAGRTYVIDHVSQDFDAHLRLTDELGKELARDDDSGGNLNARIRFQPPRTSRYMIHAGQLFSRPGRYTLTIRAEGAGIVVEKKLEPLKFPTATAPNAALPTEVHNLPGGAKVTFVPFAGNATLLGDVVWSRDGAAIIVLDSSGVLHRLRVDDWVEERRLELGRRAANLSCAVMGPVVSLPDQQEVWGANVKTLTVMRRLYAPGVQRVVSSPKLRVAVAATANGLLLFDLIKTGGARSFDLPNQHLAIAPDGKHLFVQGSGEQLMRYRIEGQQIIKDDESPRIAQNGQSISVSPDGKYVCLPSGGGNYGGIADHPAIAPYSTYVYATDNLRRPAFALTSGANPRTVGFDPIGGSIFAQNSKTPLVVFSMTGEKKWEFTFPKGPATGEPREFVAYPQGNRVLVRFDRCLAVVDLPASK